jgi:5'-3' exoribonuclease 2
VLLVGNDFLPHLPSLEIREGAIDRLIRLYKEVVPKTHGYLTHNGTVNLPRVQMMMTELGTVEDEIFKSRREKDLHFKQKARDRKRAAKRARSMYDNPAYTPQGQFAPSPLSASPSPIINPRQEAYQMRQLSMSAAANLRAQLKGGPAKISGEGNSSSQTPSEPPAAANGATVTPITGPRKRQREDSDSESEPEDEVRLWEDGWKDRYYSNKFGVPSKDEEFVRSVANSYTQGLCWVLAYYYQGCPSWKWFYPFHYAPFASDFRDITSVSNTFPKGADTPFRPLEQLMGVFPAASGNFLPLSFRALMSEKHSSIIDFYPTDFKVDLNGKKFLWQGVALLPFVDETRLLRALNEYYHTLSPEEEKRNSLGSDRLFVHRQNRLYPFLKTLYESSSDSTQNEPVDINPEHTQGIRGKVMLDENMEKVLSNRNTVKSIIPSLPDIKHSFAIGVKFQDPAYPLDHVFSAVLLPNVRFPERVLRPGGNFHGPPGSYRPQLGFSSRGSDFSPSGPHGPGHRMIRHSLSDPRDHRSPQNHPYNPHHFTPSRYHDAPQGPSIANWQPLPPPPPHQFSRGPPPRLYPPGEYYSPRRPPPSHHSNYYHH